MFRRNLDRNKSKAADSNVGTQPTIDSDEEDTKAAAINGIWDEKNIVVIPTGVGEWVDLRATDTMAFLYFFNPVEKVFTYRLPLQALRKGEKAKVNLKNNGVVEVDDWEVQLVLDADGHNSGRKFFRSDFNHLAQYKFPDVYREKLGKLPYFTSKDVTVLAAEDAKIVAKALGNASAANKLGQEAAAEEDNITANEVLRVVDLVDVLRNTTATAGLHRYLVCILAEENLLFYGAVEIFEKGKWHGQTAIGERTKKRALSRAASSKSSSNEFDDYQLASKYDYGVDEGQEQLYKQMKNTKAGARMGMTLKPNQAEKEGLLQTKKQQAKIIYDKFLMPQSEMWVCLEDNLCKTISKKIENAKDGDQLKGLFKEAQKLVYANMVDAIFPDFIRTVIDRLPLKEFDDDWVLRETLIDMCKTKQKQEAEYEQTKIASSVENNEVGEVKLRVNGQYLQDDITAVQTGVGKWLEIRDAQDNFLYFFNEETKLFAYKLELQELKKNMPPDPKLKLKKFGRPIDDWVLIIEDKSSHQKLYSSPWRMVVQKKPPPEYEDLVADLPYFQPDESDFDAAKENFENDIKRVFNSPDSHSAVEILKNVPCFAVLQHPEVCKGFFNFLLSSSGWEEALFVGVVHCFDTKEWQGYSKVEDILTQAKKLVLPFPQKLASAADKRAERPMKSSANMIYKRCIHPTGDLWVSIDGQYFKDITRAILAATDKTDLTGVFKRAQFEVYENMVRTTYPRFISVVVDGEEGPSGYIIPTNLRATLVELAKEAKRKPFPDFFL